MSFLSFLTESSDSDLLFESGNATKEWNTTRATKADIDEALFFISSAAGLPISFLSDNLIGSTRLTHLGKRNSSGDIDIAIPIVDFDDDGIHNKIMSAVDNQGVYNKGTRVASYAIPVNDKKVQVDLMCVNNLDWAQFIYHSGEGDTSQYPGAVRNILLSCWVSSVVKDGEDIRLLDTDGNDMVRASRGIHLPRGLVRLFKVAHMKKDGSGRIRNAKAVSPEDVKAELSRLGLSTVKFSTNEDPITDPNKFVRWLTSPTAKSENFMTTEQVMKAIEKLPEKTRENIIKKAKREMKSIDRTKKPREFW